MKMPCTMSVKGKCQIPVPFFSVIIWTKSIIQTSKNYFGNCDAHERSCFSSEWELNSLISLADPTISKILENIMGAFILK